MLPHAMNDRWPGRGASLLLGCLLFIAPPRCEAQNLVPNPSFEEYDTCRVVNDVYYPETGPLGWFSGAGTPDHFLGCLPYGTFNSSPFSFLAFQYPQEGECYAGVATYRAVPPNVREYFMVELLSPLVIGQQYFASFYAGVGWGGYPMNPPAWLYTNGIGMLFTTQPRQWELNDPYPAPGNDAHVFSSVMITDTVGWTLVSGSFVADSAYHYLMMGNHFDNVNTDTAQIVSDTTGAQIGYVLIDNVCVSTDPEGCPMAVGIDALQSEGLRLFPNPARDHIALQGIDRGSGVMIHDAAGRVLWQGTGTGDLHRIEVGNWARGMYIGHGVNRGKRRSFKFVLIE